MSVGCDLDVRDDPVMIGCTIAAFVALAQADICLFHCSAPVLLACGHEHEIDPAVDIE